MTCQIALAPAIHTDGTTYDTAMTSWKLPKRMPIVSIGPNFATAGIMSETKAPETKPYTRQNMMIPARDG